METELELLTKLDKLTKDMILPDLRRSDVRWLSRNMIVYNENHPNFKEAFEIVKKLLKRYKS